MKIHVVVAAALVAVSPLALAAAPTSSADATAGKQTFTACAACHAVTAGSNGVGPSLFGVAGRTAGSVPGFYYSSAMKSSHITWTPQNLDAYVANPQQVVPGNHMPYSGMPDAQQRAALVAYLETLH